MLTPTDHHIAAQVADRIVLRSRYTRKFRFAVDAAERVQLITMTADIKDYWLMRNAVARAPHLRAIDRTLRAVFADSVTAPLPDQEVA